MLKSVIVNPKLALVTSKVGDTRLITSQRTYGEPDVQRKEANFVSDGKFRKIKILEEES